MNDVFMNTYHRLPVVFSRGEGTRLWDTDGREYIDFTAGIAVNCLGHNHPLLTKAISAQAAKLLHTGNYFQSDISRAFAEKLIAVSAMKNVFFCNSGAEANEGAIKICRKYSLKKYGAGRHNIVGLWGSFHGRTITTVSATGQEKFHKDFGPFTEGFSFVPPNDFEALERALDPKTTAAFIVEPVQGESGIIIMQDEYLRFARELCDKHDILFVADEIQSGLGRTGKFFAHSHAGVKADIATLAKGLAGGIPVGAVLAGEKTAEVLEAGDHGSTFGGNALAAAAGLVVLETLSKPDFLAEIAETGAYFLNGLISIKNTIKNEKIAAVRGNGLMLAADLNIEARPLLEKLIAQAQKDGPGLLILTAGPKTLRFLPPYTISRPEIDRGLTILSSALAAC